MIGWLVAALVAGSFLLSATLAPLLRRGAVRWGMIDRPAGHKAHARATPLLGGVAIFAAFAIPALATLAVPLLWSGAAPGWLPAAAAEHVSGAAAKAPRGLAILAGALVLHVVGLLDDRRPLGPWIKLGVQIAVAILAVTLGGARVLTLAGGAVSTILSVLWLVTIINAMNFLDNMDGLSAGVAAICAGALLLTSSCIGQVFVASWLALLLGALLGFLPQNFPPARMFMGDSGSLVIGYLLGVLSCLTTYVHPGQQQVLYGVFVPLVLLAVPLYDTLSVMILRIRAGASPMVGDHRHFSHRLVRRGMSVRKAVCTIYLCTAATGLGAMLLPHVRSTMGAVLVLLQTAAVLLIVAILESGPSRP